MKFSENELKKLFKGKLNLTTEALCEQLTMLGLEVEECEKLVPDFNGVVVGEIVDAAQHPNADRLKVCTVNIGKKPLLSIVCGGINARAGIKVAVSTIGACLPGNFVIKETKLRGELSQGMMCSEKELGLPETIVGIMELPLDAPVGQDVREYLDLNDHVITINLTPNRGDCLSLYGIARELAVLNHLPVPSLKLSPLKAKSAKIKVAVKAPQACPRYLLAVIEDIHNDGATPLEITTRLERSGIRSISPVVDILNDVMILTGQPMHAFDADKVTGDIEVAFAKEAEKIELLNDTSLHLRADTLTIRDATGAIAMAGIMGNKPSSVDAGTTRILVEAAFFEPLSIAGKARSYGLHTDSSHRFERGVDPNLAPEALALAVQNLLAVVGGKLVALVTEEAKSHLPLVKNILLHDAKIKKLLGIEIDRDFIKAHLKALGCEIIKDKADSLLVTVPSFRFDLNIEEDLIEELARLKGYDNLPLEFPRFDLVQEFPSETTTALSRVKDLLVGEGMHEVVTYSFIDEDLQRSFFDEIQYVLENPITKELASMRKSLVPSLLKVLQYNLNRQQNQLSIFELGERFVGIPPEQVETLAGLLYGRDANWYPTPALDFYDLKGLIQKILAFTRVELVFKTTDLPQYIHPGQGLSLWHKKRCIGYFGALHPRLLAQFDLKEAPFVFELASDIFKEGGLRQAKPISKFPLIERDLAFLVDRNVTSAAVIEAAVSIHSPILQEVLVFDVYAGDRLPANQKSIAIKLKMQDLERTLVDEEVDELMNQVVQKITKDCQATLRE